jgi:hypothetical protein
MGIGRAAGRRQANRTSTTPGKMSRSESGAKGIQICVESRRQVSYVTNSLYSVAKVESRLFPLRRGAYSLSRESTVGREGQSRFLISKWVRRCDFLKIFPADGTC